MYRILAIDYGEKRVGTALSDPLHIIAKPYMTLSNSPKTLWKEFINIIKEKNVQKIILGLPVNLNGEDTKKTLEVRKFATRFAAKVGIEPIFWDERYTTANAREALIQMKVSIKDSKKIIDSMAASLILRSYLEANP